MEKVNRRNVCRTPLGIAQLNIVMDFASVTDVCQTKQDSDSLLDGMVLALHRRTESLQFL